MSADGAPVLRADDGAARAGLCRGVARPCVFPNGVFVLLHVGHADGLAVARREGAALVIGVNGDASARRLAHGPGRPLVAAADRARPVAALAGVAAVAVDVEDLPLALIEALRPEGYVEGRRPRRRGAGRGAARRARGGRT